MIKLFLSFNRYAKDGSTNKAIPIDHSYHFDLNDFIKSYDKFKKAMKTIEIIVYVYNMI